MRGSTSPTYPTLSELCTRSTDKVPADDPLRLQVGRFLLPAPGTKAQYDDDEQRYWHIGESDVSLRCTIANQIPAPWRLPSMFRDEGVRGHKYIIWRGPVYYFPPTHSGLQLYGR